MSRHSKNCTSNSIFTHHEKLKLMKEAGAIGLGSVTGRIGVDSQKKFDECELCLSRVQGGTEDETWSKLSAPVCCPKGHLFCRDCIMENLMKQKKKIEARIRQYEESLRATALAEQGKAETEAISQVMKFEQTQQEAGLAQFTKKDLEASEMTEAEKQREATLKDLQSKAMDGTREAAKEEWIKSSFWRPENTPVEADTSLGKGPSKKLKCAIFDKNDPKSTHFIKIKDLTPIKFKTIIEKGNAVHLCWFCQK